MLMTVEQTSKHNKQLKVNPYLRSPLYHRCITWYCFVFHGLTTSAVRSASCQCSGRQNWHGRTQSSPVYWLGNTISFLKVKVMGSSPITPPQRLLSPVLFRLSTSMCIDVMALNWFSCLISKWNEIIVPCTLVLSLLLNNLVVWWTAKR